VKEEKASREGKEGGGGTMQRKSYPGELSEREWALLEPLIPQPSKEGIRVPPTCAR